MEKKSCESCVSGSSYIAAAETTTARQLAVYGHGTQSLQLTVMPHMCISQGPTLTHHLPSTGSVMRMHTDDDGCHESPGQARAAPLNVLRVQLKSDPKFTVILRAVDVAPASTRDVFHRLSFMTVPKALNLPLTGRVGPITVAADMSDSDKVRGLEADTCMRERRL